MSPKKTFWITCEVALTRYAIVIFKTSVWWFSENKRENINSIYWKYIIFIFNIFWKINESDAVKKYTNITFHLCLWIYCFSCLKWVELSIISQTFLVHIVGSAKCIWSRWSPVLMTRSVKCPANMTGVCHLWSVSCGLTRTMTMCLLVESLTYFHQKILWMQQGLCYLFSESKGIAGKL